jgi:hypothetical protein
MLARGWIMIAIAIAILVLGILFIISSLVSKKKRKADYYNLFIMGIIWIAIGIPLRNNLLVALGIVFGIVGLVHKKEWKKNRKEYKWAGLNKYEKILAVVFVIFLIIALLAGIVILCLTKKGII